MIPRDSERRQEHPEIGVRWISDPGNAEQPNEDCAGSSGNMAWVIDGASDLSGRPPAAAAETPGGRLAHDLSKALAIRCASAAPLVDIVDACLDDVRAKGDVEAVASRYLEPSCSLGLCRFDERAVEYLVAGDCTFAAREQTGRLTRVSDETITRLDDGVVAEMVKISAARNISLGDARPLVGDRLRRNRALLNSPNGYWTITRDGRGLVHAKTGKLLRDPTRQLLLCSDGFARLVDLFAICTWEDLTDGTPSIEEGLAMLRQIEATDADMAAYPRLKRSDDATALIVPPQR